MWRKSEEKKKLELRPIGDGKSFCDGIKIPKTSLTETMSQVKKLFLQQNLPTWTIVSKQTSWFVKLNEDLMPDFETVKARLKELSAVANEKLGGETNFFIEQIDETKEYCGFLYAKDVKVAIDTFKEIKLKAQKDYH